MNFDSNHHASMPIKPHSTSLFYKMTNGDYASRMDLDSGDLKSEQSAKFEIPKNSASASENDERTSQSIELRTGT